ncbi:RAB1A [Lepeophtheirus salmonis]|uniref:RAB1A n=1 Tax=Lepeophtheirus salmonis TaxID=72036 RepID=A0A7R8H965_LEPSM|nr:RAB1A [Lepeophtheirus salmonis]CAF2943814.1 RAB1A [Lepeophtheirus salmonis]
MDDSLLEKNNEKGITADQPKVVEDNTTTPAPVRAAITLSKLEEEEDDVDDSDEEGNSKLSLQKKIPHGDQLKEIVGSSGSNVNVKKRKSNRRFNSSELVIESESESDEEDIKPKEQINIVKDIIDIPINSTKNVTIKKLIKKDHDVDDVDLKRKEIRTSKSEKVNKVVEVKKLEMPFATVPESGLGPAVPDVPKPPTPSLSSIATKKISSKTEKKELETVLVSSTSTKLPSIAQPTASIVKDNNNLPTSLTNEPPSEPPPPLPPKSPTGDSTSDIDSMSGKIKLEVEDSRCLDVEGSSSGDAPTNPTAVFSSSNRRNTGLKRRLVEKINDAPRSPAQKRKKTYRGSTRGRHSSGRGVGIRGNLDDETDESEEPKDSTLNSLSSLDDQALVALSQRSPKSSRYNFYVDLDPAMDSSERISLIQQNLEELRKTYLNIKSDLALIERRRKKISS